MMHSRTMQNINRIHESVCSNPHQDNTSTFKELFNKDSAVKIHTQNLQDWLMKCFKVKNERAPPELQKSAISWLYFRIVYCTGD